MNRTQNGRSRGFSIIELLIVVGVISLLVALVLPMLGRARTRGHAAKSLSNVRQLALGLSMYADANRDRPPTYGAPRWPDGPRWSFDFGEAGYGNWFDHSYLFTIAISGFLESPEVAIAPGARDADERLKVHGGQRVAYGYYSATNALYADPRFFQWETQAGLPQFGAQALSSIAHPASKGIVYASALHHYPQYGVVPCCCLFDLPTPIAFGDLSASEHIMRRMPPGMVNLFARTLFGANQDPTTTPGIPVADTFGGLEGRDR